MKQYAMFAGVIAIVLVVALFFVALGGTNGEPAVELQAADGIENPIMDSQVVAEGSTESGQTVEVDAGTAQTVTVE